jgi:hypothetical protein
MTRTLTLIASRTVWARGGGCSVRGIDASHPAALRAQALAEPAAQRTVRLIPGEFDHLVAEAWVASF